MKKSLIIFLMFIILAESCKKLGIYKDDELNLELCDYAGSELRIDGYYRFDYSTSTEEAYTTIAFYYRNGVFLDAGVTEINNLEERELEFANGTFHSYFKDNSLSWGVFQIEGEVIRNERLYPSQGGFRAFVREGEILNDSTFRFTQSYRLDGSERTEEDCIDELFYFVPFSPKVDSLNSIVP